MFWITWSWLHRKNVVSSCKTWVQGCCFWKRHIGLPFWHVAQDKDGKRRLVIPHFFLCNFCDWPQEIYRFFVFFFKNHKLGFFFFFFFQSKVCLHFIGLSNSSVLVRFLWTCLSSCRSHLHSGFCQDHVLTSQHPSALIPNSPDVFDIVRISAAW